MNQIISNYKKKIVVLQDSLRTLLVKKASDPHLTTDASPQVRINGEIHQLEYPVTPWDTRYLAVRTDFYFRQINGTLQTGNSKYSVQTMNQQLFSLCRSNLISTETALKKSEYRDELIRMIQNHDHIKTGEKEPCSHFDTPVEICRGNPSAERLKPLMQSRRPWN